MWIIPDGYYLLIVNASDMLGNEGYDTVEFSIRNWAVLEMLPNTANNKAGRTMPVTFSLRIAEAVDPIQPFVRNEELNILIYEEWFDFFSSSSLISIIPQSTWST